MEKKTTAMDNGGGMAYILCAITALGILFNLLLVIWHCKNLRSRSHLAVTVKYTLLLMNVSYIIAGFAIIVMVLHRGFGGDALCKAGGFLVMFSTQESIWTLAGSCAALFLWTQNKLSQELQKHNIPIFFLILVIQGLVLLVLSFLPFTEMHYFDTQSPYYYLCVPLRFPGEKSWAYSSLILVMNWISIVLSIAIVLAIIIKYRKHFRAQGINRKDASVRQSKSLKHRTQLATGIYIALCVDIICWFIILVTINSGYFNQDGHSRTRIQWILGFSVSATTVFHSVILLGTSLAKRCQACCCCTSGEIDFEKLNVECPKTLEQVEKIPKHHGDYNIRRYLVHWNDPTKANFRAGVMKVFPPWCKSKWQNEVYTLWKLQQHEPHPNIVKYVWVASQNHFHQTICALAGDVLSRESSITCIQQYPNGSLEQYLRTRVGHLTEVGMHKIVLDMARGLSYLQGHRMVHNNLTSQSVYMASISDKTGLKVVIGDFEECQEVPKEDTKKKKIKETRHPLFDLYSISQHVDRLAMENNCFSADIRSFGLILLELLACVSQHNHRRQLKVDAVTRSADDVRDMSRARPMKQVQSTGGSTHQHNGAACTCSSRVTDIRAHKRKKDGPDGESAQTASTDDHCQQPANVGDGSQPWMAKSGQLHSFVSDGHHQSSFQEYKSPKAGKTNIHHGEMQILPQRLSETDNRSVRSGASKKESKSKKASNREQQPEPEDIVRSSKRSKASSTAGSVKSQRSMSDDASSTQSKIQDRALPPLPKEAAKHVKEAWVEGEMRKSDHPDALMTEAQSEGSQADGAAKSPEKVTKQQKAVKTNPKANRFLQLLPFSKATPVLTLQEGSHTEESSDFKPVVVRPRSAGGLGGRSGLKTNGSLILSSARPGMVYKPKAPCSKIHVMSDGYGGKKFSCGHLDEIHGPHNAVGSNNGGLHVRSRSMDATSVASLASFETIYEEDGDHANHPRPPRPARFSRFHVPVTQLPSIPNDVESVSVYGMDDGMSETSSIRNGVTYMGGRNHSFLSLDDSVVSADSGIGGNSGSDYATQSDVSSYYFNNRVGAREPIYSANESVSDSDSYSAFRVFITKNKQRLKLQDSGVESAADSCDDASCANGYHIDQQEDVDTGHLAAKGARVDSDTRVNLVSGRPEMFESDTASIQTIYEQLAEVEPKQQVQVEDSDQNEATEASGFHSTSGTSSPFSMIETSTKGTQTGSSLTRPKHNNDESSLINTSKEIAYEKIAHPVKVTKTVSTSTDKDDTTSETSNPHNITAGKQYTYRKTGESLRHAHTSPFVLHDKIVHDSLTSQNALNDSELQKQTSNPNSQTNYNRLNANVGAHRLSRPSLSQRSVGTRHYQGPGDRKNSSYSPRDIHHRQPSRPASMASLISDAQQILQAFGMSTSFHDDSVVEESLSPEGAASVSSNLSSDLMTSHELDPRSGLGPQQLKYCNDLSIKYSFVHLGILLTPDKTKLSNMLGIMKQHGKLGYTASQMVPLLADCWLEDPVPNAGDILDRLNEVLPTAAV